MASLMWTKESQKKPHILAVPFPGQGHISPLLHLCKAIAAQGFTVSFVNVASIHEQMQNKLQLPTPHLDIRLESIPFEWFIPKGFDAYCMENQIAFNDALPTLGAALGDLIERLSEEVSPVLAILSDHLMPWTQRVANKYGIPRISLWCATAACLSLEFHAPELVDRGQMPAKELIDWIPGLSPLRPEDFPAYLQLEEKHWAEIILERSAILKEAKSWVLVNSFHEVEPDTLDAMRKNIGEKFVSVGPIFLHELPHGESGVQNGVLWSEDDECIRWLNTQKKRSVLYISFGSMAVLSLEQFQLLAGALESLGQPFLWVIRLDLVVGEDDVWSQRFCERTKKQGRIISWAPQPKVLGHPSVGGFLTHCGWNSMLESISNGVPMLGWPWGAEQNLNCKLMVEDWKIGAAFAKGPSGLIEKAEIERAVNLLMNEPEGEEMLKTVGELKMAARKAVNEGGRSLNNLQAFLAELRSLALCL